MQDLLTILVGNAAFILPLFLWVRSEARADARHTDLKLEATRELVREIHASTQAFRESINK